jgi:hypothetical protein
MTIGKKYQELDRIEKTRDRIEKDLLSLEKYEHKKDYIISQLIAHLKNLTDIYKKEKAWYLLDKVLHLEALLNKRKNDLRHHAGDFDIYFSFLKKIVDLSKDALVSPLILPNLNRLAEQKIRQRMRARDDIYLSFHFKSVYYIIPFWPCKTISNFNYKKRIRIKYRSSEVVLSPLYREFTSNERGVERLKYIKILFVKGRKNPSAFYIDGLGEKLLIKKKNIMAGLKKTLFPHKNCLGVFRMKGTNYYYLEV